MEIIDCELDMDELALELSSRGWKRIGLQFPEGLKPYAREIRSLLEGYEILDHVKFIVSGSPCFGACDCADHEFSSLGAEGMVHFGHTMIPSIADRLEIPVIFRELHSMVDPILVVRRIIEDHLIDGIVGITTTVQYIHRLEDILGLLLENGFDARIGIGTNRLAYPGQVLGCSFSSANAVKDADMHLFIGEGLFHPLGIQLSTGKKVIAGDPRTGLILDMEEEMERILRQRFAVIQTLKDTSEIGIIVSTLPGQERAEMAKSLERTARFHGIGTAIISVSHISPDSMKNIGIRTLVSTACPRVAIDDYSLFLECSITMATPNEFLIALGIIEWQDYRLDVIED